MSQILSPYGLKPVSMIGGHSNNGGAIREFPMTVNSATAIYNGDVVQIANGQPSAITATPVAGTTAGIVGVCVGVSYFDPVLKQSQYANFLPANAVNSGYTNIRIRVCDGHDQLYQVQGSAAFGSLTNGVYGAIGKNAALGNFGGNAATGNSTVNVVVGTNGASLATTATLAVRIVSVLNIEQIGLGSSVLNPQDAFPELIVKFNQGVHSYQLALGA